MTENKYFVKEHTNRTADLLSHVGAEDSPWYPSANCTECMWSEQDGKVIIARGSFCMIAEVTKVYRGEVLSMALIESAPIGGKRIFLSNQRECKDG